MSPGPSVGIAVVVRRDGRFLMGLRRGAHGSGTWSLPGGHVEHGESFQEAAAREVLEETSVAIGGIRIGAITNDLFAESGKHYVTIWAVADPVGGTPEVREPDKFTDLTWVSPDALPSPLFAPWRQLARATSIADLLTAPATPFADLI
jgi:8-oxo-dGTP diphosphatase